MFETIVDMNSPATTALTIMLRMFDFADKYPNIELIGQYLEDSDHAIQSETGVIRFENGAALEMSLTYPEWDDDPEPARRAKFIAGIDGYVFREWAAGSKTPTDWWNVEAGIDEIVEFLRKKVQQNFDEWKEN